MEESLEKSIENSLGKSVGKKAQKSVEKYLEISNKFSVIRNRHESFCHLKRKSSTFTFYRHKSQNLKKWVLDLDHHHVESSCRS